MLPTTGLERTIDLEREQQDVLIDRLLPRFDRILSKQFQVMVLEEEELLDAVRRLVRPLDSSG